MVRKTLLYSAAASLLSLTTQTASASPHGPVFIAPVEEEPQVDDTSAQEARRDFRQSAVSATLRPGDIGLQPYTILHRAPLNITERSNDRLGELQEAPATAGMQSKDYKDYKTTPEPACEWFCNPSVFTDYTYVNIDDNRKLGSDGYTNSWSGGFDFTTKGDILLGALYAYSHDSLGSAFLHGETKTDTHFVSLYAAKTFWSILNIGISGGYGHTEVESTLHPNNGFKNRHTASSVESWNVSPFIGVSKRFGAFSLGATATYLFSSSDTDAPDRDSTTDTGKLALDLKLGYSITEKLTVYGTARYTQALDYEEASPDFPEDRKWATFGAKVAYRVSEPFSVFGAWTYDAFNTSYDNHTGRVGASYAF